MGYQASTYSGQRGCALGVIERQHRVVIGDVERPVVPGDPGRRGEIVAQHMARLGHPVTVSIAQQHELVG